MLFSLILFLYPIVHDMVLFQEFDKVQRMWQMYINI